MSPDDANGPISCACGVRVVVAELLTKPPMFALVEEAADATSGYLLALPRHVAQLAAPFIASEFGSFRMHQCCGGAVGGSGSGRGRGRCKPRRFSASQRVEAWSQHCPAAARTAVAFEAVVAELPGEREGVITPPSNAPHRDQVRHQPRAGAFPCQRTGRARHAEFSFRSPRRAHVGKNSSPPLASSRCRASTGSR